MDFVVVVRLFVVFVFVWLVGWSVSFWFFALFVCFYPRNKDFVSKVSIRALFFFFFSFFFFSPQFVVVVVVVVCGGGGCLLL